MPEVKWPVGSIHPVYGEVKYPSISHDFNTGGYSDIRGFSGGTYVAVKMLDATAELHSFVAERGNQDLVYDTLKSLPPESLDAIEHMIYMIHQENNHHYPEN